MSFKQIDPRDFGPDDATIFRLIQDSEFMIVDASSSAPPFDYSYSLGVRHSLTNKPTLLLYGAEQFRPSDIQGPIGIDISKDFGNSEAEIQSVKRLLDRFLTAALGQTFASRENPVKTALESVPRVFLSDTHADSESVLAVDQWLRDRGARVDIDARNFTAGKDIRDEIIKWVQLAGKVICFYSKASSNRYYPKLERRLVEEVEQEWQESKEARSVLIYFRLDDTQLPAEGSYRLAINAWLMSFDDACSELWRHILEQVAEPTRIPLSRYRTKAPWAKS